MNYLGHFLFITFSIIFFSLPFYTHYRKRTKNSVKSWHTLNAELEHFFDSREVFFLVLLWAAAEAVFWYIIPEFLLLLLIFLRSQKKLELLGADILGTTLGTTAAYYLGLTHIVTAGQIPLIPYITPEMTTQVAIWYANLGILALVFQPFSGIPYKVFTLLAPVYRLNVFFFLFFAIVVRVARYYIFFMIFSELYPWFHRFIYKNYVLLFLLACFIFSVSLVKVVSLYGKNYTDYYAFKPLEQTVATILNIGK